MEEFFHCFLRRAGRMPASAGLSCILNNDMGTEAFRLRP